MKYDNISTRMKEQYEVRTRTFLPRRTNTIILLDGKAFHTYTRGMKRPYDLTLMKTMDETTKFLCEKIQGCRLGYTQSDEISLLLCDYDTINTDMWFDGNVQKICSISASMATAKFNQYMMACKSQDLLDKFGNDLLMQLNLHINPILAFFDARVFSITDNVEVNNYFVWRQQDATRNSIQMAAQSVFPHKELQRLNTTKLQEKLLAEKQINWNDYPQGFKRGRVIAKTGNVWCNQNVPIFSKEPNFIQQFISERTFPD